MAKVSFLGGECKAISLDALLVLLVVITPVVMFFFTLNGNNPFVDGVTSFVVLLMSAFLLVAIWINRSARIPILDIFILIYVLFWHLRFLTLTLFPDGELVLTRTVTVDHLIFNRYVWIVFLSLIAAVCGIFIAYFIRQHSFKTPVEKEEAIKEGLSITVNRNIHGILIYCSLALLYQIIAIQLPESFQNGFFGYVSFFFPFTMPLLLAVLVLFNGITSRKYKVIFMAYIGTYATYSILTGTRSLLLYLVLCVFFVFLILRVKILFRLQHLVATLLLVLLMFYGFAYGTYQREIRSVPGMNGVSSASFLYVLNRMRGMDSDGNWKEHGGDWKAVVGKACARAGYLDYSAEIFANPRYGEVISFVNILKSVIDGYIPGSVFEDSGLVAIKMRGIYNPHGEGYQSDAIGAVGENYLLFGTASALVISLVAFVFTYVYYAINEGIFGIFLKFSVAIWLMTWWNSFGYDWLILDVGRQLLFGTLVIAIVFRSVSPIAYWKKIITIVIGMKLIKEKRT